ncbi:uncharacterized protein LOC128683167 isoform X2 [Plodia interpunctella]|nr:uncharacterized protein LOC128683167 isoform X2 [Plodia interpunctella]XP_053624452.1 uncharacterized protein LOC128683167 isoform X2 [Plodia interpunctella]
MVQSELSEEEGIIKIFAIYDLADHLVELKFVKNEELPRILFQIIGLIIPFQKYLTTITIHQGIDVYGLYEITKFLPTCNVTDLCFDGTILNGGSYGILFENFTSIKRICLSRCKIDDTVIETIASQLVHPLPASKSLLILDLSTNRITDIGAKHMAHALRSNRALNYLNLSDNSLTDVGGEMLLESLMNFQITNEELQFSKEEKMKYLRKRNELITHILKELRTEFLKGKRKSVKPLIKPQTPKKGKGIEREGSLKAISDDKLAMDFDSFLYERACIVAELQLGVFNDPFSRNNLVIKNGIVYCLGNNTLCYLNLSYNNLTYLSLKTLLKVVKCQKGNNRKPQGIINVAINGNYLPVSCAELLQIEDLLNVSPDKISNKKRAGSRSVSTVRQRP